MEGASPGPSNPALATTPGAALSPPASPSAAAVGGGAAACWTASTAVLAADNNGPAITSAPLVVGSSANGQVAPRSPTARSPRHILVVILGAVVRERYLFECNLSWEIRAWGFGAGGNDRAGATTGTSSGVEGGAEEIDR